MHSRCLNALKHNAGVTEGTGTAEKGHESWGRWGKVRES
jgi:hypothetical protein